MHLPLRTALAILSLIIFEPGSVDVDTTSNNWQTQVKNANVMASQLVCALRDMERSLVTALFVLKRFESDSDDDDKSIKTETDGKGMGNRPSNHSEIEKRRRDKMNLYIADISALVPLCAAMSRKLDKLTVLRLAVQHIKTLRGCSQSYGEGIYRPSCVSDQELGELLNSGSEGFLMVISCEKGRIMHVSEAVEDLLGWSIEDLINRSCFDLLRKEDAQKLKDQMHSGSVVEPNDSFDHHNSPESVSSSTSSLTGSLSCFCPGAKRLFYCRMKRKPGTYGDSTGIPGSASNYKLVRCSGYLKFWPPTLTSASAQDLPSTSDSDPPNFTCLALNILPVSENPSEFPTFACRLTLDGRLIFVDQSVCNVFGGLPQEALGRSYYDFVHEDDLITVAGLHQKALEEKSEEPTTAGYRVRGAGQGWRALEGAWRCFCNPWTGERDFIVVLHRAKIQATPISAATAPNCGNSIETTKTDSPTLASLLSKMPDGPSSADGKARIGAGRIGQLVAQRTNVSDETYASKGVTITSKALKTESAPEVKPQPLENADKQLEKNLNTGRNGRQGAEEASMSVLMSLLDAEGGLGGPVDYGEMPWPL